MKNPLGLQSLQLHGYRCFSDISIDFDPHLTVLVAQNGAGKTSILDAVAVALGPFVGAFDEAVGAHFVPDDIRQTPVRGGEAKEMEFEKDGVSLVATGFFPNPAGLDGGNPANMAWERRLAGPSKAKTTVRDCKALVAYGKHLQGEVRTAGSDVVLPLVAYYGTGRLWQRRKLMDDGLKRSSRTIGYTDCLDPGSSYKAFAKWYTYWVESAFNAGYKAMRSGKKAKPTEFDAFIASVNGAVNHCLKISGWGGLDYSVERQELVVLHKTHGELPVSMLSDGIRNMVAMIADIAFRATKLNPQLGAEAAKKTPGIVLIDEVDMHLHPAWQQTVLPSLRKAFPKMQFIVTTHSPQILTTVPSACIRILKDGAVFGAPPGTAGAEASRLLTSVLGVEVRPPLSKETRDLNEYLSLVDQDAWDSKRAKQLRKVLDARYQGEEPALFQADLHIETRKWEMADEADMQRK